MKPTTDADKKDSRAENCEAVRSSELGRPLAETSARTRDWQVLTILPGGWIDIDCNSGEERYVPRRTKEGKRPTVGISDGSGGQP